MKKFYAISLAMVFVFCITGIALADPKQDCIDLCTAAAKMMKEQGVDAAVAEINKKDGKFVKGDIYVFAQTMEGVMVAHPMNAALIGKNMTDLKDKAGKAFFKEFMELAKTKGSGWVDYMWPKPGATEPSEKTSYILRVEGMDYFVGAGIYK